MSQNQELRDAILASAKEFNLEPELLACVVLQESGGNPLAYNYEDQFYHDYLEFVPREKMIGFVPKGVPSLEDEKRMRSASWGAAQCLGETARELGFAGQWLTELRDISNSIYYGAKYLAKCIKRCGGDVGAGLLRYNGGGNKNYAPEVLTRRANQEYRRIL